VPFTIPESDFDGFPLDSNASWSFWDSNFAAAERNCASWILFVILLLWFSACLLAAAIKYCLFLNEIFSIWVWRRRSCLSSSSCTAMVLEILRTRGGGSASQYKAVAVAVAIINWDLWSNGFEWCAKEMR
jgi:high-affinity Fe2+/Pb2+ permease